MASSPMRMNSEIPIQPKITTGLLLLCDCPVPRNCGHHGGKGMIRFRYERDINAQEQMRTTLSFSFSLQRLFE